MKHSVDVYRFEIEKQKALNVIEISNVISWELIKLKLTNDELISLKEFINNYLKNSESPI
jgi:hypothetical protein